MKIIIATGIFPPDVGGPANYAKNLAEEFAALNHEVMVFTYTDKSNSISSARDQTQNPKSQVQDKNYLIFNISRKIPTALRHFAYFLKLLLNIRRADFILVLDAFSAALPAIAAAKIFRKKIILRTGGDFLWEQYAERTGDLVLLRDFYRARSRFNLKENIIFILTRFVLKKSDVLVFSTNWQKQIFLSLYGLENKKTAVIENFYGLKIADEAPKEKNFVCACRNLKLKNLKLLKDAFDEASAKNKEIKLEIITGMDYTELMERIKRCYAVILASLGDISPNFLLDAIKLNKPFISTEEIGLYERLKNIGVFVNPLDKEDIKNKILFLADDKNYSEFKNKVLNFSFTHSWQEIANEFIKTYEKISEKDSEF